MQEIQATKNNIKYKIIKKYSNYHDFILYPVKFN